MCRLTRQYFHKQGVFPAENQAYWIASRTKERKKSAFSQITPFKTEKKGVK